ncbi:hypothetical protein BC628DRAFT_913155 [Trametes gibbosa]|nr:hypothetical protein BC628DRAFT_913155 [Trametes gibbosa]
MLNPSLLLTITLHSVCLNPRASNSPRYGVEHSRCSAPGAGLFVALGISTRLCCHQRTGGETNMRRIGIECEFPGDRIVESSTAIDCIYLC